MHIRGPLNLNESLGMAIQLGTAFAALDYVFGQWVGALEPRVDEHGLARLTYLMNLLPITAKLFTMTGRHLNTIL